MINAYTEAIVLDPPPPSLRSPTPCCHSCATGEGECVWKTNPILSAYRKAREERAGNSPSSLVLNQRVSMQFLMNNGKYQKFTGLITRVTKSKARITFEDGDKVWVGRDKWKHIKMESSFSIRKRKTLYPSLKMME